MWKRALVGAVVLLLVGAAAYASFYIAPTERTMGLIQRIFYFHAASAWAGMTAFSICFVANLLYVWRRQPKMGLTRSIRRRGWSGVHYRRADYRPDLGQTGVGNLLDLGRAADFHVCALAAVHFVSFAAHAD